MKFYLYAGSDGFSDNPVFELVSDRPELSPSHFALVRGLILDDRRHIHSIVAIDYGGQNRLECRLSGTPEDQAACFTWLFGRR